MTGLITQYLGSGLAADRPATPDVNSAGLAFYFATDTETLSLYDQNDAAWQTVGGGAGDLLSTNNLSDVASATTAATNLGLGTGDSPHFTAINLGHASDTTLTRVSAGVVAVEGSTLAKASQTTECISGFIASPSDKSYKLVVKIPHAGTITETTTISVSGTCTATFKVNSTALGGTANSVSSAEESQAHASTNTFAAGDDIVLTVSSNSSCVDMSFTLKYTRTLA